VLCDCAFWTYWRNQQYSKLNNETSKHTCLVTTNTLKLTFSLCCSKYKMLVMLTQMVKSKSVWDITIQCSLMISHAKKEQKEHKPTCNLYKHTVKSREFSYKVSKRGQKILTSQQLHTVSEISEQ